MDPSTRQELIRTARWGEKQPVSSDEGLIISSHPIVSHVGAEVLRDGGNAVDAYLAAAAAQTVVEPHMTTITGTLSLLYRQAATGTTTHVNGGMNCPLAGLDGLSVADLETGRGVPVPGWWAGFEGALERFGTRSRADLLAPAIELARGGFEVSPFLFGMMFEMAGAIGSHPTGRELYFDADGGLKVPGDLLVQHGAADTLEALADGGNEEFYRGAFAQHLVEVVQGVGGVLSREDLDRYEVRFEEPVVGSYRGYEVIGTPPPTYGGLLTIEALNMLEVLDLAAMGPVSESAETLVAMVKIHNEVRRQAADTHDPTSHPTPTEVLLSKEFARMRWELIRGTVPLDTADYPGSCHLSVIDRDGNIATGLHSVMSLPWHNGLFCEGVSVSAGAGHFLTTMPLPGQRGAAGGGTNILLDDGRPFMASGSPGTGLFAACLQVITDVVDFGMSVQEAVHRPRFGAPNILKIGGSPGTANMVEADLPADVIEEASRHVPLELCNPRNFSCGSWDGFVIDPDTGTATACPDPRRTSAAEAVAR